MSDPQEPTSPRATGKEPRAQNPASASPRKRGKSASGRSRTQGKSASGRSSRAERLRRKIARLPQSPGVYLMRGRDGQVFYVGKASNLRARVRSYFNTRSDGRSFVALLDRILYELDFVVTANEKEALLLENNLIKEHRPRYNVRLRDDKNYLALRIDPRVPYPRLELVRRIQPDGAHYFGPYHSAQTARRQKRLLDKHFQLRTCSDRTMASRHRPCLNHQIGRCLAPCTHPVDPDRYAEQVRDVELYLSGRGDELAAELEQRMFAAAEAEAFEEAARLRDLIRDLEVINAEQHVVEAVGLNQDVLGLHREGAEGVLCLMTVRQGRLVGSDEIPLRNQEFPDHEMLSSFIGLRYEGELPVPDEVLLPVKLPDAEVLADWLSERRGRRVRLLHPQRGYRRRLLEMAERNARAAWLARPGRGADAESRLERLGRRLRLARPPRRIECYDISTLGGYETVASLVVMQDGELVPGDYRHFRIRNTTGRADDYGALREALTRRFERAQKGEAGWEPPDLLLIDGGKGQLGVALSVLEDLGIPHGREDMAVAALAKERVAGPAGRSIIGPPLLDLQPPAAPAQGAGRHGLGPDSTPQDAQADDAQADDAQADDAQADDAQADDAQAGDTHARDAGSTEPVGSAPEKAPAAEPIVDRVFLPGVKDPIRLRPNSTELFLLAQLRDEAHRFAITHHRKLRRRSRLRSGLLDIPGVGPKRAKALLRHFGSLRGVRQASLEALSSAPGVSRAAARAVFCHFHPGEEMAEE